MADQYTIYIDSILRNGNNNSIVISGWALDEETKTVPSIHVEGFDGIVQISYVYRGDVNALHKLASNVSAGFQIELDGNQSQNDVIQLVFEGNHHTTKKEVNLNQKFPLVPGTEGKWLKRWQRVRRGLGYIRRNGLISTYRRLKMDQAPGKSVQDYQVWISKNENWDVEAIQKEIQNFKYQPKISILMPVYNVEQNWLEKCIHLSKLLIVVAFAAFPSTNRPARQFLVQTAAQS